MANWGNILSRGNVEDRRGMGEALGGLGVGGIAIALLVTYLSGGNMGDLLGQLVTSSAVQTDQREYEGEDMYEVFASQVLGSLNETWDQKFKEMNKTYEEPRLVLFRSVTDSECGGADARVGPHYCPPDRTIYLDETFFDDLTSRLGAEGGDVAQAYVIAHEVGHHVQHELGRLRERPTNEQSISTELQADCFAGVWAHTLRDDGIFEEGEIREAIDAARAVGDDNIQKTIEGKVNPEQWTHGSSAERMQAFTKGYETGKVEQCTF